MNDEQPKAPKPPRKCKYTDAQKRATYAYREKNRESYNTYQREYHAERMRTDLDYRNRKSQQSRKAHKIAREKKEQEQLAKIILKKEAENEDLQNTINAQIILS